MCIDDNLCRLQVVIYVQWVNYKNVIVLSMILNDILKKNIIKKLIILVFYKQDYLRFVFNIEVRMFYNLILLLKFV